MTSPLREAIARELELHRRNMRVDTFDELLETLPLVVEAAVIDLVLPGEREFVGERKALVVVDDDGELVGEPKAFADDDELVRDLKPGPVSGLPSVVLPPSREERETAEAPVARDIMDRLDAQQAVWEAKAAPIPVLGEVEAHRRVTVFPENPAFERDCALMETVQDEPGEWFVFEMHSTGAAGWMATKARGQQEPWKSGGRFDVTAREDLVYIRYMGSR